MLTIQMTHRRWVVTLASIVAVLVIAGAALAQRRHAAMPGQPSVAYVNGVSITENNVQSRMAALLSQTNGQGSSDDVRRLALQLEIKDEILYQAAPNYGITISQSDLESTAAQAVQQIITDGDAAARSEFYVQLQSLGITADQYSHDPRVLAAYRRGYLVNAMRRWIEDRMAPEDRVNQQAILTSIDQFIANQHAAITYP